MLELSPRPIAHSPCRMGNGHNPRYPVSNGVNDLEMVLVGGAELAVVGITFQRVSVGMVSYLFKGILNFIDELRDNLRCVRPVIKEVGPAIKLNIRRFDQNGIGLAYTHSSVVIDRCHKLKRLFAGMKSGIG